MATSSSLLALQPCDHSQYTSQLYCPQPHGSCLTLNVTTTCDPTQFAGKAINTVFYRAQTAVCRKKQYIDCVSANCVGSRLVVTHQGNSSSRPPCAHCQVKSIAHIHSSVQDYLYPVYTIQPVIKPLDNRFNNRL